MSKLILFAFYINFFKRVMSYDRFRPSSFYIKLDAAIKFQAIN